MKQWVYFCGRKLNNEQGTWAGESLAPSSSINSCFTGDQNLRCQPSLKAAKPMLTNGTTISRFLRSKPFSGFTASTKSVTWGCRSGSGLFLQVGISIGPEYNLPLGLRCKRHCFSLPHQDDLATIGVGVGNPAPGTHGIGVLLQASISHGNGGVGIIPCPGNTLAGSGKCWPAVAEACRHRVIPVTPEGLMYGAGYTVCK